MVAGSGRLPTPHTLLVDFQQRGDLQGADKGGDPSTSVQVVNNGGADPSYREGGLPRYLARSTGLATYAALRIFQTRIPSNTGGDYALQLSIWARLASGRDRSRNQPIMLNPSMFRPTSNSTCFTARLPTIVPTSAGPSSRLQDVRISRDRQSQQRYRVRVSKTSQGAYTLRLIVDR